MCKLSNRIRDIDIMKITLLKSGLNEIEHNIRPPMKSCITLPVSIDGRDYGIVVYVAMSPFNDEEHELPSSVLVSKVAAVLAQRVQEQTIF